MTIVLAIHPGTGVVLSVNTWQEATKLKDEGWRLIALKGKALK